MELDNSSESTPPLPPSEPPKSEAVVTESGHIRRELPQTREVSGDRFNKNPTEGGATVSGEAAKSALSKYNSEVKSRYEEVKKEFEEWDPDVSPIKDPEFKSFIRGQLAYANMAYVTMGTFPADVRKTQDGEDPHEDVSEQLGKLSPELRGHPAARLALEDGADLSDSLDGED